MIHFHKEYYGEIPAALHPFPLVTTSRDSVILHHNQGIDVTQARHGASPKCPPLAVTVAPAPLPHPPLSSPLTIISLFSSSMILSFQECNQNV